MPFQATLLLLTLSLLLPTFHCSKLSPISLDVLPATVQHYKIPRSIAQASGIPLQTPAPFPSPSSSSKPKALPNIEELPIESSSCGFARITRIGVTVQKGGKARLKYDVRIRAIEATVIAENDGEFVALLTTTELIEYKKLKGAYKGGLNVPFLQFLGIDLGSEMSTTVILDKASDVPGFEEKAKVARRLLVETVERDIRIKGKLKAKGVSCVTTSVFAFIKLARVNLGDGDGERTVLTTTNEDVEAATMNGDVVLPSKGKLDLIDV